MESQSKTRFMGSMWRDLPASVLEKVFTFLPIASVCRFRTLSKEWNRSISSPGFKHAGAAEEDYALITPRWVRPKGGWVVLDVARQRYFTLSDDFLTKHVHRQELVVARKRRQGVAVIRKRRQGLAIARQRSPTSYLAATDGGLFCVRYSFTLKTSGLFVCNPVLQTVKQLPHAAGVGWREFEHEAVVMAVDRSSMEYEVIIVNTAAKRYTEVWEPFEAESIFVYESKTGSWRTAPYQPSGYWIWWRSLTIFNNNLYCIVNRGDSLHGGLVSYDKETGVVSDLRGIDFPPALGWFLVVSKARFFCVVQVEVLRRDVFSVEIFEIDVVERASIRLTKMPRALLIWVLGHDVEHKISLRQTKIKVASGSADYILIAAAVVGRCAAYSLSHKLWYHFPDDRTLLEEFYRENMTLIQSTWMHGGNNCLSLCAP